MICISDTHLYLDTLKPSGAVFSLPEFSKSLRTSLTLPNLLSHSLLVYRADTTYGGQPDRKYSFVAKGTASNLEHPGSRLPPLLLHETSPDERHYHAISQPFYLHSHRLGPFISSRTSEGYDSKITIYSSGEAGIQRIQLKLAWRETLGRLGVRYWMGLAMWSIAVVGILQLLAWRKYDSDGSFSVLITSPCPLIMR